VPLREGSSAGAGPRTVLLLGLVLELACSSGRAEPGRQGSAGREGAPEAKGAPAGGFRLSYRLRGGIAGFDVRFVIDGSGSATYARLRPRPLRVAHRFGGEEMRALARLVKESGFLALEPRYEPAFPVSDAFTYELRWEEEGVTREVTASDGAPLPEALVRLREAIGALERTIIAEGAPVAGSDEPDRR
jgi:hypothetical protein